MRQNLKTEMLALVSALLKTETRVPESMISNIRALRRHAKPATWRTLVGFEVLLWLQTNERLLRAMTQNCACNVPKNKINLGKHWIENCHLHTSCTCLLDAHPHAAATRSHKRTMFGCHKNCDNDACFALATRKPTCGVRFCHLNPHRPIRGEPGTVWTLGNLLRFKGNGPEASDRSVGRWMGGWEWPQPK